MTNTNPVNQEIFSVVAQAKFGEVFSAICDIQSLSQVVITNGREPKPKDFEEHIGHDELLVALINTDQSIKAIDPKGNYPSFEERAAQFYKDCAELGINALVIGFDDHSACNGIKYVHSHILKVNDGNMPTYLKHDGYKTSVEQELADGLAMLYFQYQRTEGTAAPVVQGAQEQQELSYAFNDDADTKSLVFTAPAQYVER